MADVKAITHPITGKTFKLGRNKPIAHGPHLRLSNYMLQKFPTPPTSCTYITAGARPWLADILGNDQYGDCTIAAAFHVSGAMIINAGRQLPPDYTPQTAEALYFRLTGGDDTGLDEQTVFNWWQQEGLLSNGTHQIAARVIVDPTNQTEVKAALWLFENLYLTAALPDAWVSSMPESNGFTWDVAGDSDPDNGHAFCAFSYGLTGVSIDTWGLLGTLTYPAMAKYNNRTAGGGCYAVVSMDSINSGSSKAPNGFNWTQLVSDIQSFQV